MKQTPMVRAIAAACLVLLLVAACGQGSVDQEEGGAQDDSQADSPGVEEDTDISVPTNASDIQPRDDLKNERVSSWSRYEIVDDTTIRIFFTGGDPKCFSARAIVEESPSEIRVALVEGSIPEAPEVGS